MSNQTLKDVNCLVSCVGLYADIEDDSLKQNVLKGRWSQYLSPPCNVISGFNLMTQELGPNLKRIQDFFQQLDVHERIKGDLFFFYCG